MVIPVLILFGPTASGKTSILLRLFGSASAIPAEVVSADSIQVYRGMNIGTAKPTEQEQTELLHHLIDIRDPHEQFNAGDFVHLADKTCADIARRGKLPIISGGAGFYLRNFILGLPEAPPSNEKIRTQLKQELAERGLAPLLAELAAGDQTSAERIHINDEYRLLRALEVLRLTGHPLSSFGASGGSAKNTGTDYKRPDYRFLIVGLTRPREELYRRINGRCTTMFQAGLPTEVRSLYEAGYTPKNPGLRAIGYREFFVENRKNEQSAYRLSQDLAGVEALVAQNSRRYAKRQLTFFASLPGIKWINAGQNDKETAELVRREVDKLPAGEMGNW